MRLAGPAQCWRTAWRERTAGPGECIRGSEPQGWPPTALGLPKSPEPPWLPMVLGQERSQPTSVSSMYSPMLRSLSYWASTCGRGRGWKPRKGGAAATRGWKPHARQRATLTTCPVLRWVHKAQACDTTTHPQHSMPACVPTQPPVACTPHPASVTAARPLQPTHLRKVRLQQVLHILGRILRQLLLQRTCAQCAGGWPASRSWQCLRPQGQPQAPTPATPPANPTNPAPPAHAHLAAAWVRA